MLLQAQGKLDLAEPFLRRALEGRERTLGRDHLDTVGSANDLGLLLYGQDKFTLAEPLFRHALEGNERILGRDHPNTLKSVSNLRVLLKAMKEKEK